METPALTKAPPVHAPRALAQSRASPTKVAEIPKNTARPRFGSELIEPEERSRVGCPGYAKLHSRGQTDLTAKWLP